MRAQELSWYRVFNWPAVGNFVETGCQAKLTALALTCRNAEQRETVFRGGVNPDVL